MTDIDDKIRAAIAAHEDAHHLEIREGRAAVEHVAVMEGKPVAGEWAIGADGSRVRRVGDKTVATAENDDGWIVHTGKVEDGSIDLADVWSSQAAADAWARANPHLLDWQMPPASEPAPVLCNRTACRAPGAVWWNTSTRAYYCTPCAHRINEGAPGLCVKGGGPVSEPAPRETPACACRHAPNHVGPLPEAHGCPCGPSCPCIAAETPAAPTGTPLTAAHLAAVSNAIGELTHVDASIGDRVTIAEQLSRAFGFPWPPYPDATDDDDDDDDDDDAAPTGTPQSWDDPRLAGDPNKGRTCLRCGGIVPAGTRHQHANGRCVAAPTGTARDLFDTPAATWQAAIDRHMLHANKCTKCTSEHLCPTGAPLWARYVELFNAREVAAPPPLPAEPRGEAMWLDRMPTAKEVSVGGTFYSWWRWRQRAGESWHVRKLGAMEGGKIMEDRGRSKWEELPSLHGQWSLVEDPRPTVTPAPAPQPVTPPDAARAIAKMMGKLDDEDKATFNWLCAGVRELKPVSGEVAEAFEALKIEEPMGGGDCIQLHRVDVERHNAHVDAARAHVERLAREVSEWQRTALNWKTSAEARDRDAARAYNEARDTEKEAATLRARVAELEAERDNFERLSETYHRQSLLSSQVIRDTEIERDTLRTRVAELESERAALDARLLAAVESVPTSAPMEE